MGFCGSVRWDARLHKPCGSAASCTAELATKSVRDDFDILLSYGFHNRPFIPWPIADVLADRYVERSVFNEKMWTDIHRHWEDISRYLGALDMPVLLVWGDRDRILHVSSVSVDRRHIPHLETVILEECGHLPMLELPKMTARRYVSFLKDKSAGTELGR